MEKIDVLVKVSDENNVDGILGELKEYSNDMDFEIIKKSIRAVGQIIVKIDKAAKKAVEILHEIVSNGGQYGLQEAVIVAKDIFRKFPNKYDALIKDFCSKLEAFYEPDSKAAMIWIVGEYAEKIPDAEKIMNNYIDTFMEEPVKV